MKCKTKTKQYKTVLGANLALNDHGQVRLGKKITHKLKYKQARFLYPSPISFRGLIALLLKRSLYAYIIMKTQSYTKPDKAYRTRIER